VGTIFSTAKTKAEIAVRSQNADRKKAVPADVTLVGLYKV
jgi:hypothetical protein